MLSFTVRMTLRPGRTTTRSTRFSALYPPPPARNPAASPTSLTSSKATARTVLIYEQYKDEAALDHHRATPHFHQYAIGGLYQMMKERQVENLTAVC